MPTRSAATEIMYRGRSSITYGLLACARAGRASGACTRTSRSDRRFRLRRGSQRRASCVQLLTRILARDLLQLLERLALLLGQLLRDGQAQPGDQVALAAALQLRRAVTADAQLPSVLRAGGNLE